MTESQRALKSILDKWSLCTISIEEAEQQVAELSERGLLKRTATCPACAHEGVVWTSLHHYVRLNNIAYGCMKCRHIWPGPEITEEMVQPNAAPGEIPMLLADYNKRLENRLLTRETRRCESDIHLGASRVANIHEGNRNA